MLLRVFVVPPLFIARLRVGCSRKFAVMCSALYVVDDSRFFHDVDCLCLCECVCVIVLILGYLFTVFHVMRLLIFINYKLEFFITF